MQLSNLELLGFVIAVVCFGLAGFFAAVVISPTLWQRLLKRQLRGEPLTPAQLRASRLSALCLAGINFAFGANFLARSVIPLICNGQDALRTISTVALITAAVLGIVNIRFSRQLQKASPIQSKRQNPLVVFAIAFGVFALAMGVPFLVLRTALSQPFETLDRIEMVSETEGWALGSSSFTGIMYRYENGIWQRETIPQIGLLTGLSMSSPDSGWAVSNSDQMLQYQRGTWNVRPAPVGELYAVDMVSDDEGWAVGNFGNILHFSGGAWQPVQSPTKKSLHDVAMVSATDGWIVGGGGSSQESTSVILRYQEGEWKEFPNPTTLPLLAVHVVSPDEAWAVGGVSFRQPQSVILHFRRGEWASVPNPAQIPLSDVSVSSAGEGWAVGGGFFPTPARCENSTETVKTTTILRYTDQTWSLSGTYRDVALQAVSMLDATEGWMVGWNTFWRYDDQTWKEEQVVP